MADLNLEAAPFLGGYARDFGTVQLREETGLYLRSIAIPLGGEKAAAAAVKKALGVDLPAAGASVTGKARVLATAADQYLAISDGPGALDKLGDAVYVTDQSDVWAALTIDVLPRAYVSVVTNVPPDSKIAPDSAASACLPYSPFGTIAAKFRAPFWRA